MSTPSAAALVAMGLAGITPSPAPAHGPGRGSSIQGGDMSGLGIPGVRDVEEERMKNIEEVVRLIGMRSVGRGVSREGVELIGRSVGCDCLFDGNTLSIAGVRLLVDIEFDAHDKEVVKGIQLSLPMSSGGETSAEDAANVLKRDLTQTPEERIAGMWKNMEGFKANLERLARLDRLSAEVNCFQAVEGLYESMRKIWDTERQRNKTMGPWKALCQGALGRPVIHEAKTVGLALEYWAEGARILDMERKERVSLDDMEVDNKGSEEFPDDNNVQIWSAVLECEQCPAELYPSVRVTNDWVSEEVFKTIQPDPLVDGPQPSPDNPENTYIDWQEPLQTFGSPSQLHKDNPDAMVLDSTAPNSQKLPDVRFVARFEPPILVPWNIANQIHQVAEIYIPNSIQPPEYHDMIFSSPLAKSRSSSCSATIPSEGSPSSTYLSLRPRRTSVTIYDSQNNPISKKHVYQFYPKTKDFGRYITDIPFSHPRQLHAVLPLLRQYALLFNLLRCTLAPDSCGTSSTASPGSSASRFPSTLNGAVANGSAANDDNEDDSDKSEDENGTRTITNQPPLLATLDTLLASSLALSKTISTPASKTISLPHTTPPSSSSSRRNPRPITLTLTTSTTNPSISLTTPVTLPPTVTNQPSSSPPARKPSLATPAEPPIPSQTLNIDICILPNGIVTIPQLHIPGLGLDETPNTPGDAEASTADAEKTALREMWTKRIIKAVEIFGEHRGETGGLGAVVEWILDKVEKERRS
jgi:hypothetical protein